MAAKRPRKRLHPRELGRWRLIAEFQSRLQGVCERRGVASSFEDPRRKLELGQYLGLFLFGLLNPAVRTMRALCSASALARLQREICGRPVSLGSFSETQAVVDPGLLEAVFQDLAREVEPNSANPALGGQRLWSIVDSTLWETLPRMHWALWRHQGRSQTAVRLHVGLHLIEEAKPAQARITAGRVCERKAWREMWQPGDAYVGDRYYGEDYRLFGELDSLGCAFVLRLRDEAVIDIEQELPLSPADRAAHVTRQAWAVLGCKKRYRSMRVRLVWVETPKEVLILVANQPPENLSAELVAELYRQRWKVELFFRWIKCILGCRHWLAESPRGVAIQIYLALIAALLLQLYSGRRPTRRMMELIQLYLMDVATLEELEAGLARELTRLQKRAKR